VIHMPPEGVGYELWLYITIVVVVIVIFLAFIFICYATSTKENPTIVYSRSKPSNEEFEAAPKESVMHGGTSSHAILSVIPQPKSPVISPRKSPRSRGFY
jgi:uncharacterized membrane protein YqiK